jgi:hypothetical protein
LAARPDSAAITNLLSENLIGRRVWTERRTDLAY